ncbi:MAG: 16S rRNA (guanine(966)-N(2))-methyltransferase RsmD [Ignavibacteria bacterium]|nr:16S rRNA (guanine(966)-N(2))-methyltransferase RsmD [Ignavibacteria bacterium]
MRIISGELKNRKIKTIKTPELRPATDRYRETLFNILRHYIDFEGITACDLYAGTGAVGFEAISRGAKVCTFVERDFNVYKLIIENAKQLGIEDKIRVVKDSAENYTRKTQEKFDLIFADPPYNSDSIYEVYRNIISRKLISENGVLVIQRSRNTIKEDTENFMLEPYRKVGGDVIYLKVIGEN